ncbi:MAG: hypothetical protein MJ192_10870 [Clostridia bacterium]|nr:hypothetical protein [Clostridia bacterium]
MKKRSLLLITLTLMCCLLLLAACNQNGQDEDTGTEADATVGDPTAAPTDAPTEAPTEEPTEAPTEAPTEEPTENYFDVNRIDLVEPDPSKIPDMTIADDGYNIFTLTKGNEWGYRYGCTYLYNDDGSIDAYFACVGTISGEWDWISYRHSPDGGETWGNEKVVLTPTQNSMDHFSNCDPGVVYFNGYYYLGYTSTLNSSGYCNNLFVARSKNPDGPFDKWNGNGWGGPECQPIVYFDENWQKWGIGEPSFIELNGTLYLYYTSSSPSGEYCMVATADATDENWPATLKFHGSACKKTTDSLDVKYVEEWGKFIGVATGNRMGTSSWLALYESNDGLTFTLVDAVKEGTYQYLHNAGISSRRNGHIRITEDADKLRVIYAYGDGWGIWNTRVQPITLVLGSGNNIAAEKSKANIPDPLDRVPKRTAEEQYTAMIRPKYDVYEYPVTKERFTIQLIAYNADFKAESLRTRDTEPVYSDYDPNVIRIENNIGYPVGVGETEVTVTYRGVSNHFWVRITETDEIGKGKTATDFRAVNDNITICMGERTIYKPQIRAQIVWDNKTFTELYVDEAAKQADQGEVLTFTGFDTDIISVNAQGIITAKAVGETDVLVTWKDKTVVVHVTVTDDGAFGHFSVANDTQTLNYENLDFTKKATLEAVTAANNADVAFADNSTRLSATGDDSFIRIGYENAEKPLSLANYKGVEITYLCPTTNSADANKAQLFVMTSAAPGASEEASQKMDLTADGKQHTLTFNFEGRSFWTSELTQLRWDFFDHAANGDVMSLISVKLIKK